MEDHKNKMEMMGITKALKGADNITIDCNCSLRLPRILNVRENLNLVTDERSGFDPVKLSHAMEVYIDTARQIKKLEEANENLMLLIVDALNKEEGE